MVLGVESGNAHEKIQRKVIVTSGNNPKDRNVKSGDSK
jgi:hypothetical protein